MTAPRPFRIDRESRRLDEHASTRRGANVRGRERIEGRVLLRGLGALLE